MSYEKLLLNLLFVLSGSQKSHKFTDIISSLPLGIQVSAKPLQRSLQMWRTGGMTGFQRTLKYLLSQCQFILSILSLVHSALLLIILQIKTISHLF